MSQASPRGSDSLCVIGDELKLCCAQNCSRGACWPYGSPNSLLDKCLWNKWASGTSATRRSLAEAWAGWRRFSMEHTFLLGLPDTFYCLWMRPWDWGQGYHVMDDFGITSSSDNVSYPQASRLPGRKPIWISVWKKSFPVWRFVISQIPCSLMVYIHIKQDLRHDKNKVEVYQVPAKAERIQSRGFPEQDL